MKDKTEHVTPRQYSPPRIVEDIPLELVSMNCAGHFGKSNVMCHPSQQRS